MGLPVWMQAKTNEDIAWLRGEGKIPSDFAIIPFNAPPKDRRATVPATRNPQSLPFSTLAILEGDVCFPLHPLFNRVSGSMEGFHHPTVHERLSDCYGRGGTEPAVGAEPRVRGDNVLLTPRP